MVDCAREGFVSVKVGRKTQQSEGWSDKVINMRVERRDVLGMVDKIVKEKLNSSFLHLGRCA